MKKASLITGIAFLVLALLLTAGVFTVFGACEPMEGGNWMTCHWAGEAVKGVAVVLAVIAVIRLLVKDGKIKAGLSIVAVPTAILAALIPGHLINICGMASMRCRTHLQPAALVLGILIAIIAIVDIFINLKSDSRA